MSYQIVVPLDTSEVAESALPVARSLMSQLDARVILVSVIEVSSDLQDFVSTREFKEDAARLEGEMSAYLHQMAATFSGEVETAVRIGDALDEVAFVVEGLDNPIVVMASHGRSGFRRYVLGSVAMRLIHALRCPVFVVKASDDRPAVPDRFTRFLVPLDGSQESESVLDVVTRMFDGPDAALHLLRVTDLTSWRGLPFATFDYYGAERFYEDVVKANTRYLDDIAANLEERGFTVSTEVRDGLIADQIQRAAEEWPAQLVAMATHGRSGLSRILMGSQAERVLRDSSLPLLLVRP